MPPFFLDCTNRLNDRTIENQRPARPSEQSPVPGEELKLTSVPPLPGYECKEFACKVKGEAEKPRAPEQPLIQLLVFVKASMKI